MPRRVGHRPRHSLLPQRVNPSEQRRRGSGEDRVDLVDGFRAISNHSHRDRAVDRFDDLARPDRPEPATQLDELHAVELATPVAERIIVERIGESHRRALFADYVDQVENKGLIAGRVDGGIQ